MNSTNNNRLAYLYQLQNASLESLQNLNFEIAVLDIDDSGLSVSQIQELNSENKTLYSYISIGEAENYRSYWTDNNWDTNTPDFILEENSEWEGNFRVKFWDEQWQLVIFDNIETIVNQGYNGAYLDIVEAYMSPSVIAAYELEYPNGDIREEMENFIISLSNRTKAINPNFKIIPQNGIELLAINEASSINDTLIPNRTYLNAIDGVGKEDTFTDDNIYPTDWGEIDLKYLNLAVSQNKFVLATEYPTTDSLQENILNELVSNSFIPFIGNRALDGSIDDANYDIYQDVNRDQLSLASYENSVVEEIIPVISSDVITSPNEYDENHINYFLLSISSVLDHNVSVDYTSKDGTAVAGEDYISTSGRATILAGELSVAIAVEIIGDTLVEEDETFSIVVSNIDGSRFVGGVDELTATHTIVNDDFYIA
jgi:cysteinyl-tRNA synthetase